MKNDTEMYGKKNVLNKILYNCNNNTHLNYKIKDYIFYNNT